MNLKTKALLCALLALGFPALAADQAPSPVANKFEIDLWNGPAPDSAKSKAIDKIDPAFINPKLTVFQPSPEKSSGSAVLIIPGGGYSGCAVGHEGFDIANWFVERGVTGCVLQYRRPVFNGKRVYDDKAPSDDASRALRIIRSHAVEWGVKESRIGVMGFSAGGHLAATIGTHFDAGKKDDKDPLMAIPSRPDFMILIYPVIDMSDPSVMHTGSRNNLLGETPEPAMADYYSCQKNVSAATPMTFLLSTTDDGVKTENSIQMYLALKAKKVPCEIHVFEKGGHGYGMRPTGFPVVKFWPSLLETWLYQHDLIPKPEGKK